MKCTRCLPFAPAFAVATAALSASSDAVRNRRHCSTHCWYASNRVAAAIGAAATAAAPSPSIATAASKEIAPTAPSTSGSFMMWVCSERIGK
jgi:hypothetical protein